MNKSYKKISDDLFYFERKSDNCIQNNNNNNNNNNNDNEDFPRNNDVYSINNYNKNENSSIPQYNYNPPIVNNMPIVITNQNNEETIQLNNNRSNIQLTFANIFICMLILFAIYVIIRIILENGNN